MAAGCVALQLLVVACAGGGVGSAAVTDACAEIAALAGRTGASEVEQRSGDFPGFREGELGSGCIVEMAGPITTEAPVPLLVTAFADSLGPPWMRDDTLVADGPAMTVYGLWHDEVLCLIRVDWGEPLTSPDVPREAGDRFMASAGCELRSSAAAASVPSPA